MSTGLVVRLTEETDYNGYKLRKMLLVNVSNIPNLPPFLISSSSYIDRHTIKPLNHLLSLTTILLSGQIMEFPGTRWLWSTSSSKCVRPILQRAYPYWCTVVLVWAGLEHSLYWTPCCRGYQPRVTSISTRLWHCWGSNDATWSRHTYVPLWSSHCNMIPPPALQSQYVYIHDALSEYIQCGDTEFTLLNAHSKLATFRNILNGKTGYLRQFEVWGSKGTVL